MAYNKTIWDDWDGKREKYKNFLILTIILHDFINLFFVLLFYAKHEQKCIMDHQMLSKIIHN